MFGVQKYGHSQRKPNGIPQAELQPRAKSLAGIEQSGPSELVIYRCNFPPPICLSSCQCSLSSRASHMSTVGFHFRIPLRYRPLAKGQLA